MASGVSIENAFIGNYSGLVNFCCIVRAYQDGVVFQASDACVELDLDPCFIQGVLVPTVQNANELVLVMDGVNGGTAPYIYTNNIPAIHLDKSSVPRRGERRSSRC